MIIQPKDVSGTLGLKWDKSFGEKTAEKFQKAQKFVDRECIHLMAPYTPMRYGILYKSAMLDTVIGSGEIHQNQPYAHYMYYGKVYGPNIPIYENGKLIGFFSHKGKKKHPTGQKLKYDTFRHPQAGPFWFKRMAADHKDEILQGAAKIAGGKAK